jgi:hypothetical protein
MRTAAQTIYDCLTPTRQATILIPLQTNRPARLKSALLALLIFLPAAYLLAGKPWRPAVDQLVTESELIVIGKVTGIEPSLVKNPYGHPCALAEIRVTETLKGTPPKTLLVAVEAAPVYDEKGIQIPISTAYRYDLKHPEHTYVLFLAKPSVADAVFYVPAGNGSGIVDLDRDRPGDGPSELKTIRAFIRK